LLGRSRYHRASATRVSFKIEFRLKYVILEAVVDSLGISQEGTFHISFTLHIYYNIFFLKNQILIFKSGYLSYIGFKIKLK